MGHRDAAEWQYSAERCLPGSLTDHSLSSTAYGTAISRVEIINDRLAPTTRPPANHKCLERPNPERNSTAAAAFPCNRSSGHYHLSLNREGRWGTTDDFTTSFLLVVGLRH